MSDQNARELHEHLREEDATKCHSGDLIEMATIMSLLSENSMTFYTDRKGRSGSYADPSKQFWAGRIERRFIGFGRKGQRPNLYLTGAGQWKNGKVTRQNNKGK
jgi:hypothetical protein